MSQYDDQGVASTIDNETGEEVKRELMTIVPSGVIAAEISQQVATARAYPRRRDRDISNEIMGRAILNEAIAKECMYSVKRGNKPITGPSIRFAEIVRASYGNIRIATRFVRIDADDPLRAAVIVEGVAFDMETNGSESAQIRRSIMTSDRDREGKRITPHMYNADMTNMTVNAAQSIARRNVILTIAPKALWIGGYQRSIAVVRGDQATLVKRRDELIAEFEALGASPEQVFAALGVKDAYDIGLDHMPAFIGMLNAVNDGEAISSVLGRFGPSEAQPHERVENPLKDDINRVKDTVADSRTDNVKRAANETAKSDDSYKFNVQGSTSAKLPAADIGGPSSRGRDPISTGRPAEPAGERSEGRANPSLSERERTAAPAGKAGPPKYEDGPGYLAFMRWHFEHNKVPTSLKDVWAKTRVDRRELLSVDENDTITSEYNAAQTALI